ncbi:DUF397 domain-containing protein [Hamadaea sp. NPDC051192]|uniref:DUF397 domain-containing protein n=1 Tax=Hamadaea sp. NPDC051192 TaxID=3154940 RepID=UPI00344922E3
MPAWKRSTRCDSGTCVEVASLKDGVVVRDSKDPDGPVLRFTNDEWHAFILGAQQQEFNFFN